MTLDQLVFSFNGRINRAKYWAVVLGLVVVNTPITVLEVREGLNARKSPEVRAALAQCEQLKQPDRRNCFDQISKNVQERLMANRSIVLTTITWIIGILCWWISLVITIKRLHDVNKSGWYQLWFLIPVIGFGLLVAWCWVKKGTDGANRFGPDPLNERVTLK